MTKEAKVQSLNLLVEQAIKQSQRKSLVIEEMPRDVAEKYFQRGLHEWLTKINANRPANKPLKFVWDDEYSSTVNDLIEYHRNAPDSKLDLQKGLYIAGNPGSRKTTLLEIFSLAKFPGHIYHVRQNNCQMITERFIKDGFDGIQTFISEKYTGVYDDLGVETKGKYFGNELMVMSYVIQQQNKNFLQNGYKPKFTSNYDVTGESSIDTIYGLREGSRIEEMCNIIYLGGDTNSVDYRRVNADK